MSNTSYELPLPTIIQNVRPNPTLTEARCSTVRDPCLFRTSAPQTHDVSKEESQKITDKWQFGRGSELTYYDIDTFRTIFGVEAGTLLFGYARGELRTNRTSPSVGSGSGRGNNTRSEEKDIFGNTPGCKFSLVKRLTVAEFSILI